MPMDDHQIPAPAGDFSAGDIEAEKSYATSATGSSSSEETEKRALPALLSYDELPEWYRDNAHIQHGYRPVSGSTRVSIFSWLFIHNETVNIYTHLIPAVLFLLGEWYVLQYLHDHYPGTTLLDYVTFANFLWTAAFCLGTSTMFHTMINHSCLEHNVWLRRDFLGICYLTFGMFQSGIYMIFWCEPMMMLIYFVIVRSMVPSRTTSLHADVFTTDHGASGTVNGHRYAPQATGPTLVQTSNVLLHRHGCFRHCTNGAWYLPLRLPADRQAVGSAILSGRGPPPQPRHAGVCCE